MAIQIKDGQQSAAADPTTQRGRDLMIQLVRQGQDASLKSLQVWADLARQLGCSTAHRAPAGAAMVSLAYDLFEKLLVAQRWVSTSSSTPSVKYNDDYPEGDSGNGKLPAARPPVMGDPRPGGPSTPLGHPPQLPRQ